MRISIPKELADPFSANGLLSVFWAMLVLPFFSKQTTSSVYFDGTGRNACDTSGSGNGERMKLSVFVGTSVDGFLARHNGTFDFLDAGGNEPHGYEEFFASIDTLVIGRNTYEVILAFPEWPYGDKRVVVLSTRPLDFSKLRRARVEQMSGAPAEIAAKLSASGAQHVYVDGGITIQRFLRAGLINSITVTRVPILIGEGIPLFGSLPRDVLLRHVATQTYTGGLVKTEYEVLPVAST